MIVKCGRCRVELEVAGPGEFLCPACGARNKVTGAAGGGLGGFGAGEFDIAGGYGYPGSTPAPAPPPAADGPAPGVRWETCPSCRFRFARGEEVEEITCPNCSVKLSVAGEELRAVE